MLDDFRDLGPGELALLFAVGFLIGLLIGVILR